MKYVPPERSPIVNKKNNKRCLDILLGINIEVVARYPSVMINISKFLKGARVEKLREFSAWLEDDLLDEQFNVAYKPAEHDKIPLRQSFARIPDFDRAALREAVKRKTDFGWDPTWMTKAFSDTVTETLAPNCAYDLSVLNAFMLDRGGNIPSTWTRVKQYLHKFQLQTVQWCLTREFRTVRIHHHDDGDYEIFEP